MSGKHLRPKLKKTRSKRASEAKPSGLSERVPHPKDLVIVVSQDKEGKLRLQLGMNDRWPAFSSEIDYSSLNDITVRFNTMAVDVLRGQRQPSAFAAIGYDLFVSLFPEDAIREMVREEFLHKDGLRIQIVGDRHLFPWNFLHINGSADTDPKWFWGARARISRSRNTQKLDTMHPARLPRGKPLIQLGLDSTLIRARNVEVPHIMGLDPKHASARRFDPLDAADSHGQTVDLQRQMISGGAQIIHFACHGDKNGGGGYASFTIDADFEVRSDVFFAPPEKMPSGPMVFLNACEMATVSLDTGGDFVGRFLNSGARVVLAPECRVSDDRSSAFACSIYDKLVLGRKTLADAVRETTCEMLERNEFTGLVYTIHGQSEVQLT